MFRPIPGNQVTDSEDALSNPGLLDEVARHTCIYPIRHGAQVDMPSDDEMLLDLCEKPAPAGS